MREALASQPRQPAGSTEGKQDDQATSNFGFDGVQHIDVRANHTGRELRAMAADGPSRRTGGYSTPTLRGRARVHCSADGSIASLQDTLRILSP